MPRPMETANCSTTSPARNRPEPPLCRQLRLQSQVFGFERVLLLTEFVHHRAERGGGGGQFSLVAWQGHDRENVALADPLGGRADDPQALRES